MDSSGLGIRRLNAHSQKALFGLPPSMNVICHYEHTIESEVQIKFVLVLLYCLLGTEVILPLKLDSEETRWTIHIRTELQQRSIADSFFGVLATRGRPQSIMHCITWSKCLQQCSTSPGTSFFRIRDSQRKTCSVHWKIAPRLQAQISVSLDPSLARATIQRQLAHYAPLH
jgi:hypothetical protein